jgi:hypothetical protein
MSRGGQREGSGRKSVWKHSETQAIRVPKIFVAQILDYAQQLDAGSPLPERLGPFTEKEVAKKTGIPEKRLRSARTSRSEAGYNIWLSAASEDSTFNYVYSAESGAYFSV